MPDSNFPNPLSPDTTKDSYDYGLKVMQAAYEKWNLGTGESSSQRRNRYAYNRLFASGKQPMEEYKDILDLDGEKSVINLSYHPLPIAIPFINRLMDRYMQRVEKIQCNAIDPISQSKKEKAKSDALFKLKEKEKIMAVQQEAGVELEEFSEEDPTNESELDIQFGFNYKQREEVIMEQGIDIVLYDNSWSDVMKKRVLYDAITAGVAQVKTYIDPNGRIKCRFTKPEYIISSFTEWDDFRDAQYQGEYYEMSIYDIRLKYPGKIDEEKLWELAQSKRGINGNPASSYDWNPIWVNAIARPYDNFKIPVIQIYFKTLYNLKYEVNKDRFDKEILDPMTKFKEGKEYLSSPPYEVEYEGVWIPDTKFLLQWGQAKNQIKTEKNLVEVISPYVTFMYGNNMMTNTPLIETMIPSIKMMQLIDLQEQKIIANAAPDGFIVDISTMSDITLGEGLEDLTPAELYKIYKQTGVQYYKRKEDDGEGTRTVPIEPSNVPFSGKLEQLMNKWNQEYDKLSKIVGSNNLDQGFLTNGATGKQVLQDARQIGESASNYIYEMYLNIFRRTAKNIMYRLWDVLVYGKKKGVKYYDGYRLSLGDDRIEYIKVEASDDFEKAQFDVKIEAVIDDSEAQLLEQNIQIVLAGDPTMLPDVTQARLLAKTNIKYATYYLMSRYEKRRKQQMQEAQANSEQNAQIAIQAAQAKSQGDMELATLKAQLDSQGKVQELEVQQSMEVTKYTSILKVEMMKSILSQEGKTVNDLPPFIFSGVSLVDEQNKQLILGQMEAQAQEQQQLEDAQMQEEMMAQQQQHMPPQEQMIA